MNKQLLLGVGLGAILAAAGGAIAYNADKPASYAEVIAVTPIKVSIEPEFAQVVSVTPKRDPNEPEFADVINVKPIKEQGAARQVCRNQSVTHRRPVQDENRVVGTATGAIIGGLLGHQVGGGNGKKVATAVGAVAGGYAGNQVQGNMQRNDTYQTSEQRCSTVRDKDTVTGYEVTYSFDGQRDVVQMDHKPGKTIPVVNGELVLDQQDSGRVRLKQDLPKQYDVVYSYKGREDSIVLDRDPGLNSRFPIENDGSINFNATQTGRVLVPREEVRGYDVVYRVPGEKDTNVIHMDYSPTVGTQLPMQNGKVALSNENPSRKL